MQSQAGPEKRRNLYSLQTHETEIAEIKTAPADASPTRGVVEPTEVGQSKITFGQIKELFDLPSNYHSATKITVVSESYNKVRSVYF